jgi:uncharacterized protein (TIGR03067 family)
MCRYWLLLSAVALLSQGGAAEKPQKDEDKLRGLWTLTSSERNGKKEIEEGKLPLGVEFTAETFRFQLPAGARHPQPYKLDAGKKPKAIDWLPGDKNRLSKPLLGIYELEGDTLKICWGKQGGERPREFKSTAGGDEWLWVLKRAKKE